MSSDHRYHHGNLRRAVLDQATEVVRERGASQLSLRELAATIGVTHAAPRRYFSGRQALLDAVAVDGFVRLGGLLREAIETSSGLHGRVLSIARVYLDFAISEANLVELMFAHKHEEGDAAVGEAAEEAFASILQIFQQGELAGELQGRNPERVALTFLATLQGLAGLVNCGVVPADRLDELTDETVAPYRSPGS